MTVVVPNLDLAILELILSLLLDKACTGAPICVQELWLLKRKEEVLFLFQYESVPNPVLKLSDWLVATDGHKWCCLCLAQ